MLFRTIRGGGEGLLVRVRTGCKPRANNSLFLGEKGVLEGVVGKPVGVRVPPSAPANPT